MNDDFEDAAVEVRGGRAPTAFLSNTPASESVSQYSCTRGSCSNGSLKFRLHSPEYVLQVPPTHCKTQYSSLFKLETSAIRTSGLENSKRASQHLLSNATLTNLLTLGFVLYLLSRKSNILTNSRLTLNCVENALI